MAAAFAEFAQPLSLNWLEQMVVLKVAIGRLRAEFDARPGIGKLLTFRDREDD